MKQSVFCYGCTTQWNCVSLNKDVLLGVTSNCRFYSFVSDVEDIKVTSVCSGGRGKASHKSVLSVLGTR